MMCVTCSYVSIQPVHIYTVRWAAVSPIAGDDGQYTLDLVGGLTPNPESSLVYFGTGSQTMPLNGPGKNASKSQLIDKINFTMDTSNKVRRRQLSALISCYSLDFLSKMFHASH